MREVLFVDCLIRGAESRTGRLAASFFQELDRQQYHVTRLCLMEEDLKPLMGEFLAERERLLAEHRLDDPRFRYAHQFARADEVVIAAPFWDLSFPALLKIYLENICLEGVTFGCDAEGLHGLCRGGNLIFLTTRGGIYGKDSPLEQGSRYLAAMKDFFGFRNYRCVAADGLDIEGFDVEAILTEACGRAAEAARELSGGNG